MINKYIYGVSIVLLLSACGDKVNYVDAGKPSDEIIQKELENDIQEPTVEENEAIAQKDNFNSNKAYSSSVQSNLSSKIENIYSDILDYNRIYGPYFEFVVVIDKAKEKTSATAQTAHIFKNGELAYKFKVSTARPSKTTPSGVYMIDNSRVYKNYTSLKYGVSMPHAMFFNGGIALHAAIGKAVNRLGRRDSSGCIRFHPDDIAKFWQEHVDAHRISGTENEIRFKRSRWVHSSEEVKKKFNVLWDQIEYQSPYRSNVFRGYPYTKNSGISVEGNKKHNILLLDDNLGYVSYDPISDVTKVIKSYSSIEANGELNIFSTGWKTIVIVKSFSLKNRKLVQLPTQSRNVTVSNF